MIVSYRAGPHAAIIDAGIGARSTKGLDQTLYRLEAVSPCP